MSINFEKDLNKQQFAAVTSTAKHLRIVAGAGTGKTRVLTYRLAYLISERHIAPKRIVAITFTNKVAAEMKERVYNLLTDSERMLGSPLISTFHGFCYRFLSREITHMQGFTNKFQIADDDVQNDIFKSFAEKLGYKMKSPYMSLLVGTIRNLKTKGVFVDQISNSDVPLAAPFTFKVLEEVYSGYQEKLKQSNLLDFDDLLMFTLRILKDKYGIEEEDLVSAELEIVPAGPARDYGLDRSMVAGYGHDDRVCAFTSLKAILDVKEVEETSVCILVDKEEIGSVGATGAQSMYFEDVIAELLNAMGYTSYLDLKRTMTNAKMLSSDVSAGLDPLYPQVCEGKNAARFNRGIVINKYTGRAGKSGSNDANPEYMAWIRKVFDGNNIHYQTSELGRVDQGGGGTIAYILGNYNMNVIDAGVSVFNMHAPMEIVSKADVYEAYLAYKAFLSK